MNTLITIYFLLSSKLQLITYDWVYDLSNLAQLVILVQVERMRETPTEEKMWTTKRLGSLITAGLLLVSCTETKRDENLPNIAPR